MKNKILVSTILLMLFLFPFSVLGQATYERTPSGITIQNPITFDVGNVDTGGGMLSWKMWAYERETGYLTFGVCVDMPQTAEIFVENLPYGDYTIISYRRYASSSCEGVMISEPYLEYDWTGYDLTQFFVVPPPITAGFEDYTMASTTAYIGDLWNSAGVYIYLFIGIPLGFWIIKRVIEEAKIRKVKGRKSD